MAPLENVVCFTLFELTHSEPVQDHSVERQHVMKIRSWFLMFFAFLECLAFFRQHFYLAVTIY